MTSSAMSETLAHHQGSGEVSGSSGSSSSNSSVICSGASHGVLCEGSVYGDVSSFTVRRLSSASHASVTASRKASVWRNWPVCWSLQKYGFIESWMSTSLASSKDTKQQTGDSGGMLSRNGFRRACAVAVAVTNLSYRGANLSSSSPLHFARHKS